MQRDSMQLLNYEAKRRPELADMLTRLHEVTDEEIDAANFPLPWFKKALVETRDKAQKDFMNAQYMAVAMDMGLPDSEVGVNEAMGITARYMGESKFIRYDVGRDIEILRHELVFFPVSGGMWLNEIFCERLDINNDFEQIRQETREEYVKHRAKDLEARLTIPERKSNVKIWKSY